MELLSVIRRWHYRDHFSIREISRRTGLSRNTVRKYLRSDTVEPKFNIPDRPSKLDPYADGSGANSRRRKASRVVLSRLQACSTAFHTAGASRPWTPRRPNALA